jgi:hypothetical protein
MRYMSNSELVGHRFHRGSAPVHPGPPIRPCQWDETERLAFKAQRTREYMANARERKAELERAGVWF